MKARILTAILLMSMSALTTFAQTSRRETSERRNNDNNNNSTTNVEQRTDQRTSGNNANQEKSTVTTNNDARSNSSQESRTNADQRRNYSSQESRTSDERRNNSATNANNSNNVNERRSAQGDYNRNNSDERRGDGREYSNSNERRGENSSRMREGDHDRDNRSDSRDNRRDWNHSHDNDRVVVRNRYDSHPRHVVIVDRHYTRPANRHVITYRAPVRRDIFWSVSMSRDFRLFYPEIHTWRYSNGYRIPTIPAYNAWDYAGDVVHIYGRVQDIYFEPDADEFYLYFGDFYPRQDLTIVIPGNIARQYAGNPFRYFQDQYVSATGYVQMYDGRPEMLIRSTRQMDIY